MSGEEYSNAIYGIIASGRGYKAIRDITGYLETQKYNTDMAIKEYKAERNAIRRIGESSASNREKITAFMSLTED